MLSNRWPEGVSSDLPNTLGIPRLVRETCSIGMHVRRWLDRWYYGGQENLDHGRGLPVADRAARLHRSGPFDLVGTLVDELSQHPGAGSGARVLH